MPSLTPYNLPFSQKYGSKIHQPTTTNFATRAAISPFAKLLWLFVDKSPIVGQQVGDLSAEQLLKYWHGAWIMSRLHCLYSVAVPMKIAWLRRSSARSRASAWGQCSNPIRRHRALTSLQRIPSVQSLKHDWQWQHSIGYTRTADYRKPILIRRTRFIGSRAMATPIVSRRVCLSICLSVRTFKIYLFSGSSCRNMLIF